MIVTRFAPSPTGRLHVGNIRTALVNWLYARSAGGRFLLRLDDTDRERSTEAFAEAIRSDLAWLGLAPDGEVRQSLRTSRYDEAFSRLRSEGRIYPAYETAEELEIRRKVQLSRGLPPVYDRAALNLSAEERQRLEAKGVRPHWRFQLDTSRPIDWHDLVRGAAHVDPASLSDPVVRRADGSYLYMLPSVVDDIDMGITHVVRGEDHVTNSGVQLQMFEALGAASPAFAHLPLLTGAEGGKLSKRAGSMNLDELRDLGIESVTPSALLARLGTSQPVEPVRNPAKLASQFDFTAFGRAPARFDPADLLRLNAKIVHMLSFDEVRERLPQDMHENAWQIIRPNIHTVSEAAEWWRIVKDPLRTSAAEGEEDYLREALRTLEALEWNPGIWSQWTGELKRKTGRKGRALFQPLRLVLTGRTSGPDMAGLLPLIGAEEASKRLNAAVTACT